MDKIHLLILFGGQSSEHEVSCRSVITVLKALDRKRYEVLVIGITKGGRWVCVTEEERIAQNAWQQGETAAILSPEAARRGVWLMKGKETAFWPVDAAFPVLHGAGGEDGAIQGLLELAKIPYVGCGILASAVSMEKAYTKKIVEGLGIRQAAYVLAYREKLMTKEGMNETAEAVEKALSYPVFVKPSASGSSCGVSRAENRGQLKRGLLEAAGHSRRILVEAAVRGREVECAVLGNLDAKASGVGEILAAAPFYDYDAKYNNPDSQTVVDPELPKDAAGQIRRAAVKIFEAVDGRGLARVDFFVEEDSSQVIFNEINTMPGFTAISMYPLLWKAQGLTAEALVERLIQSAFEG